MITFALDDGGRCRNCDVGCCGTKQSPPPIFRRMLGNFSPPVTLTWNVWEVIRGHAKGNLTMGVTQDATLPVWLQAPGYLPAPHLGCTQNPTARQTMLREPGRCERETESGCTTGTEWSHDRGSGYPNHGMHPTTNVNTDRGHIQLCSSQTFYNSLSATGVPKMADQHIPVQFVTT